MDTSLFLASESDGKTFKKWNVTTGECIKTLTGHGSMSKSIRSLFY